MAAKVLPDCYYSFAHRRAYAKVRRLGYYAPEAERLGRFLIHDELQFYNLYDFKSFDEANPVVTTVDDAEEKKTEEKKEGDEALIKEKTTDGTEEKKDGEEKKEEEKKEEEKKEEAKKKEEENKAADERLKKALGDVIAKFDVDY